jgi:DNA-binding YbaB/EbfC family protein
MNRAQRRAQGKGGASGGMGGMGGMLSPDLLKQAQELQNKLMQAQQEAASAVTEGTAGGGVVKAQVTGDLKIAGITLAKDVVDPDDLEMLQDLIVAAVKDAQEKAEAKQADAMGSLTGGLAGPGGLQLPGLI